ncbi:MAG: Smr/MutS family protein [Pseudomonadota bacterium]
MSRRRRSLTGDEQALWRQVAATTNRRAQSASKAPDDAPMKASAVRAPSDVPSEDPLDVLPRTLKPVGRPAPALTLPDMPTTPPSGLDRNTETRLRKGKRDPDARIDLHGMTAGRAHAALNRFIIDSRARGLRCVLVITGKGAVGARRDFGDPSPGVLRREAPVWLSTPPLASMVVNVSQAHPKHGGGGALYVYLKRQR